MEEGDPMVEVCKGHQWQNRVEETWNLKVPVQPEKTDKNKNKNKK